MSGSERQVVDDNGMRYVLGRQLGRGGQGAVFEVKGGRLAAKLIFDTSAPRRERLRNQLVQVRRLDIRELEVARPLEMLRGPSLGYVMELLTGMVPLKVLAHMPRGEPSLTRWYIAGGGLRRRLRLLARGAEVLAQLHGKGLVYADPSPHNLFVSDDASAHEVRLIDADNLHYQSSPGAPGIHTPGYGAPELVLGRGGVNTLTDAHAFAIIAFQTLALVHPLMGDAVVEGEPEREEEALEGRLPWVDHPSDDSNRSSAGIPRDIVLSPRLKELFAKCFLEGLADPRQRPGVSQWAERLYAAADATLTCRECGGTYYFAQEACPWCDTAKAPHVIASVLSSEPVVVRCEGCATPYPLEDGSCPRCRQAPPASAGRKTLLRAPSSHRKRLTQAVLSEASPLVITERLVTGRGGRAGQQPRIEVRLKGSRLSLRSLDDVTYALSSASGSRSAQLGPEWRELKLEAGQETWRLHLGSLERPHRIVRFDLMAGGGA